MTTLTTDVRRTLESLRQRVDSVLDRIRPDDDREPESGALARPLYRGPDVDMEETDDSIIVRAEVPGLKPDDLDVQVMRDRLILKGEKSDVRTESGSSFHRMERRYGAFIRTVPLPYEIDPDEAKAEYRNGVLDIRLPKTEESKGRRIRVAVRGD
jgi:HSP20 family protein